MTNLLLKNKTELFKWLSERERERERDGLWSGSDGEFWEAAGLYIPSLVSIQSSQNELWTDCTPVFFPSMWTCSFNIFVYMK